MASHEIQGESADNEASDDGNRKRAAPEGAQDDRDEKRLKINTENFKCSICLSIWHDVVSLTPCQHNFCNACFSKWYASRLSGECKCPQCRVNVLYCGRNLAMGAVVDDMLASDPSLRRPAEEIAAMDKAALIKSNFMKLSDIGSTSSHSARRSLHSSYSQPIYDVEDDDEDEDIGNRCPQCTSNSTSYTCPPGAAHVSCKACHSTMPERVDVATPQKCELCRDFVCDSYWRSQNRPGCPTGEKLQPMSERQVETIPLAAHKCNQEEKQFTKEYIDQHNLTVEGVVKDWMIKVDNAEITLSSMPVLSTSPVCNDCASKIAVQVLDKFRMSIPKSDLPPAAAQRPDCWYGHACRTQRRPQHASKYNHMCEPTSDRVVISP